MRQLEHFPNLVAMFAARAAEKGDAPFLWAKKDGEWRPTSWAETARQVASLAAALKALGLKPGGPGGSWYQRFPLVTYSLASAEVSIGTAKFENRADVLIAASPRASTSVKVSSLA